MKKKLSIKIGVLIAVISLSGLFFVFDLQTYFSLGYVKSSLDGFRAFYADHGVLTIGIYMVIYVLMAALSLPGATILTLLGGALFGLWTGFIIISFASTIGATLAFLFSRFLFKDYVQSRFGDKLHTLNQGIEKEGGFYLFTLRLVPLFPFFVINLAMGLTPIPVFTYYVVSQLGMIPGTFVYVNAGLQISKLESVQGILSFNLIFAFVLLGFFPVVAKKAVQIIRRRKAMASYKKPERFDYNLVVIGAGSAGLVASYIGAAVKAKVALIEKHQMGGDCLNTGCVPSKALLRSAKISAYVNRASEFGFDRGSLDVDFAKIMERVHRIIKTIEPHDSIERYTALGVTCFQGQARVESPWEVRVNDRILRTRNIVIATGARPTVPDLPGLDEIDYLTSDTLWAIRSLPERLLVLGGGPIGCELSQAFARLGSKVTLVQRGPQIMKREDPDVALLIQEQLASEGVEVLTDHAAIRVISDKNEKQLVCSHQGKNIAIDFDHILVALGRTPNVEGFGLESLGVRLSKQKTIETNEFLETSIPSIYCAGDVAGPYQFTHVAAHQSWYASVNALFGSLKRFRVDYKAIPWVTYTDPEVARVGLNETEAAKKGIAVEVTRYGIEDLDRAITESEAHGFIKVLTVPGKDKILGVTIVGSHAGDSLAEYVLAMKHGLGLKKILGTIHVYPTFAEANKYAAGEWAKAHAPAMLLKWVEKYHAWQRG